MANFIEILVTGNVSILGPGREDQLAEIWQGIYFDFLNLKKDENAKNITELLKAVGMLQAKIFVTDTCLSFLLDIGYSKKMADQLKREGYVFNLNPANPEQYYLQLKRVYTQSKQHRLRLQQKQNELDKFEQENAGEPLGYEYFDQTNATLSQFMQFRIDCNVVTVVEWLGYYNQLRRHNEYMAQQESKQKGRKNGK